MECVSLTVFGFPFEIAWLAVLGAVAEAGGLLMVVLQLVHAQRRDLTQHLESVKDVARRLEALRQRIEKPPKQRGVPSGTIAVETESRFDVPDEVEQGPTPEQRMTEMEQSVGALDSRLSGELARSVAEFNERLDRTRDELQASIQRQEQEARNELRWPLRLQWSGTILFLVGVGLSVLGGGVAC
jgi:DNA anti-recombination protein RmuC